MLQNAICLLTITPSIIWIDFLSKIKNYDVYIMMDNINFDTKIYQHKYPNLKFIQIKNEDCAASGYIHSLYMQNASLVFNEIVAWDRGLYYFTTLNVSYDNIWFFEDDCFFYNEDTLLNIDLKYPNTDILCKDKTPEPKEHEWKWFWPAITIHFPPPYFQSLICGVRMSKKLLFHLNEYVKQHKRLFFIEAMFPTIAYRYNLSYELCQELGGLNWRKDWKLEDFNKTHIFHPIKNIEEQHKVRSLL